MKEIKCGIYKVTNKINGKSYIGQSVDIFDRWSAHCTMCDDTVFHRALKKYGTCNFEWEILELCTEGELDIREKYYISLYHTCIHDEPSNGYNMTWGGDGGLTIAVNQYDFNGRFIKQFSSVTEAAEAVGKTKAHISACCNNRCDSCGGYLWTYIDAPAPKPYKYISANAKKVSQYTLSGEYLQSFDSAREAAQYITIKHNKQVYLSQIMDCCRKDNASAGGFMWRFYNDTPPKPYKSRYYSIILQLNDEDECIAKFESLHEASKATKINRGNIDKCLSGERQKAGGFKWKRLK